MIASKFDAQLMDHKLSSCAHMEIHSLCLSLQIKLLSRLLLAQRKCFIEAAVETCGLYCVSQDSHNGGHKEQPDIK